MNCKEKFLGVVGFDTSCPVPDWEFAYWGDTLDRWYTEGLPRKHGYQAVYGSYGAARREFCRLYIFPRRVEKDVGVIIYD